MATARPRLRLNHRPWRQSHVGQHARAEETQAESARASIHAEATQAMASELAASPAKTPAPSQRLESLSVLPRLDDLGDADDIRGRLEQLAEKRPA